jgi:hypothetical protein
MAVFVFMRFPLPPNKFLSDKIDNKHHSVNYKQIMYIYVICVYVNILDASYRQISGKYLQLPS